MNSYYGEVEIAGIIKSKLGLVELQDKLRNNVISGKVVLMTGDGEVHTLNLSMLNNANLDYME